MSHDPDSASLHKLNLRLRASASCTSAMHAARLSTLTASRAVRSAGLATGLTGEAWFHTARPVASLKGKLQPPRVRLGAPSFSEGRGQRIGSTNSMTRHPRGCHSRLLQGAVGGCKMGAHSRCLPVLGSTAPFPERSADEVSPRCHQKTCETTNVG